jgi:hypothetical protein
MQGGTHKLSPEGEREMRLLNDEFTQKLPDGERVVLHPTYRKKLQAEYQARLIAIINSDR